METWVEVREKREIQVSSWTQPPSHPHQHHKPRSHSWAQPTRRTPVSTEAASSPVASTPKSFSPLSAHFDLSSRHHICHKIQKYTAQWLSPKDHIYLTSILMKNKKYYFIYKKFKMGETQSMVMKAGGAVSFGLEREPPG